MHNAEHKEKESASVFAPYLEKAKALAGQHMRQPGFFLPASAVGERVWKVGCAQSLVHRSNRCWHPRINPGSGQMRLGTSYI